jgi:hypothetical protein
MIFSYSNRWQDCVQNCGVHRFKTDIRDAVNGKKRVKLSKNGLKARKAKISGRRETKFGNCLQQERDVNLSKNGSIHIAVFHKIS